MSRSSSQILISACAATIVAAAVVFAQTTDVPQKTEPTATFTAKSDRGFEAALAEAVRAAMAAHGGVADAMIEWELLKVTGRQGGIAGFNETIVTIRVTSGTPPAGK